MCQLVDLGTLATKNFNRISGAGNLFDGQGGKHVTITSEGDDSATIFVVAGSDRQGNNISEKLTEVLLMLRWLPMNSRQSPLLQ